MQRKSISRRRREQPLETKQWQHHVSPQESGNFPPLPIKYSSYLLAFGFSTGACVGFLSSSLWVRAWGGQGTADWHNCCSQGIHATVLVALVTILVVHSNQQQVTHSFGNCGPHQCPRGLCLFIDIFWTQHWPPLEPSVGVHDNSRWEDIAVFYMKVVLTWRQKHCSILLIGRTSLDSYTHAYVVFIHSQKLHSNLRTKRPKQLLFQGKEGLRYLSPLHLRYRWGHKDVAEKSQQNEQCVVINPSSADCNYSLSEEFQ